MSGQTLTSFPTFSVLNSNLFFFLFSVSFLPFILFFLALEIGTQDLHSEPALFIIVLKFEMKPW